jgi:hypothetical protein
MRFGGGGGDWRNQESEVWSPADKIVKQRRKEAAQAQLDCLGRARFRWEFFKKMKSKKRV